eukprot:1956175-Rhodomonas_salina.3
MACCDLSLGNVEGRSESEAADDGGGMDVAIAVAATAQAVACRAGLRLTRIGTATCSAGLVRGCGSGVEAGNSLLVMLVTLHAGHLPLQVR